MITAAEARELAKTSTAGVQRIVDLKIAPAVREAATNGKFMVAIYEDGLWEACPPQDPPETSALQARVCAHLVALGYGAAVESHGSEYLTRGSDELVINYPIVVRW